VDELEFEEIMPKELHLPRRRVGTDTNFQRISFDRHRFYDENTMREWLPSLHCLSVSLSHSLTVLLASAPQWTSDGIYQETLFTLRQFILLS
jgi:hypothetical protein